MTEQGKVDLWALSDLCTPWCFHVVVTLRIAEHLADGGQDIHDLAEGANCDPDILQQVLRHLIGKGLFEEPTSGHFALNEAAEPLLDPALRLGIDLDRFGGRMAHTWGTLLTAVRSGAPAYQDYFGLSFWDDLNAHPEIAEDFDALIGPPGHGAPDPDILVDSDWDEVHTVVDVGGGNGALLAEILRRHPHIEGTLVDFPRTIVRATEIFSQAGVADRVSTVGQSFFDPLPAGADLYILKSILNDWPDADAVKILTRCSEALGPTSRISVIGGVTAATDRPSISIETVLLGGRSRPLSEFGPLANAAGLAVTKSARKPSGKFVVECVTSRN
jgi:hypothetical protein